MIGAGNGNTEANIDILVILLTGHKYNQPDLQLRHLDIYLLFPVLHADAECVCVFVEHTIVSGQWPFLDPL